LPDLTLQLPIKAGDYEFTQFVGTVPGLAVGGARLDPDSDRTRLMVGVQFTSKSVRSARLEIGLLQDFGDVQPIHRLTHVEVLGPERVTTKGRNLDTVRKWDDKRALWFDFPIEARKARAIRIQVHLRRDDVSVRP